MNKRIEQLLENIGKLMQGHLARREFKSVTQLSALLARAQQLQKRAAEIDRELAEIESSLNETNGRSTAEKIAELVPFLAEIEADEPGRAAPNTLRIEIDWKANGKQRGKELIILPKASDSMVKFLSRLFEEFGQDVLQKLSRFQVNRGPLLSKSPAIDYLNQAQGTTYGHKRLPGTEYFVLTHSQTSQKAEDLERVCRILGMVPGSVQICAVARADA